MRAEELRKVPGESSRELSAGARRGRRVAQVVYVALLTWIIVSGSVQLLGEGLLARRVPRDAAACRDELAGLRARLASASLADRTSAAEPAETAETAETAELAAVVAFRARLGGESGRAWDVRAMELADGCPPAESAAADALARLRAAEEAMVRIGARELAPARAGHDRALAAVAPVSSRVSPRAPPAAPAAGDSPYAPTPTPSPKRSPP